MKSVLEKIALSLVLIGSINWGLVGLFKLDIIASIFGGIEGILARIIYSLIGLSGLYLIYTSIKEK